MQTDGPTVAEKRNTQALSAEIARQMLASALNNYCRVQAGTLINVSDFQTFDQMTPRDRAFYLAQVHKAYLAVWEGR